MLVSSQVLVMSGAFAGRYLCHRQLWAGEQTIECCLRVEYCWTSVPGHDQVTLPGVPWLLLHVLHVHRPWTGAPQGQPPSGVHSMLQLQHILP